MKSFKSFVVVAVIGCAMFLTSSLQAQTLKVNLKLKVYSEHNPATNTYTITKRTIVTRDVLDLLDTAFATPIPEGSKLVLINYDYFQVWAADGTVILADVASVLSFSYGNYLAAEKPYNAAGAGKTFYVYISTIVFDDGTNNFVFRGFTSEYYSQSARNAQGKRLYKDALTIKGQGDGVIDGSTAIINGQVVCKGSALE